MRSHTSFGATGTGWFFLVLAALGLGLPSIGWAQPVGPEFQVNTYITSDQEGAAVAVDVDGDSVVVWHSYGSTGSDTSSRSVQGQRYDSSGNPVGSEFQVNTYTSGQQARASVAVDADGDFIVVWDSWGSAGSDTSGFSVQGQRYDSSGNPVGSEFQLNTYTTNDQIEPVVAVDEDGDFVVVWGSDGSAGSDTSSRSVQGQRYDSSGNPVGSQFQVNTYTTDGQWRPAVAVDEDGDFVVVWDRTSVSGGSDMEVEGQRYDSSGNPVGGEFQVNTYTTNIQSTPSVAVDADGDFVVVWSSQGTTGSDTSSWSIQGQRYDSSGNPVGSEFQVNTYTTNNQLGPQVAVDADGDFVVAWGSDGSAGSDTSSYSVQGQRYNSSGNPVGGEFQVNTYTTSYQRGARVAVDTDGDLVVAWSSQGSAGSDNQGWSVQGQRFSSPLPSTTTTTIEPTTTTTTTTSTSTTTVPPPFCGDDVVNQPSEECDGIDDVACPGACQADCTCPVPTTTTSTVTTSTSTTSTTSTTTTTLPPTGCPSVPKDSCREPVEPFKALLLLQDQSDDTKDMLIWKWIKGEKTDLGDFGDPLDTDDYALCIYEAAGGQPSVLLSATAAAGGQCAGRDCWKALSTTGFKYKDKELTPDGVDTIILKAGGDGKAKIIVKGKGADLGLPSPLDVELPVTVQLQADNGECWEANYFSAGVKKNEPDFFKSKAGSPSGAFLDVATGGLD